MPYVILLVGRVDCTSTDLTGRRPLHHSSVGHRGNKGNSAWNWFLNVILSQSCVIIFGLLFASCWSMAFSLFWNVIAILLSICSCLFMVRVVFFYSVVKWPQAAHPLARKCLTLPVMVSRAGSVTLDWWQRPLAPTRTLSPYYYTYVHTAHTKPPSARHTCSSCIFFS